MSSERPADNDSCHVKWVNQSHALYLVSLLILRRHIGKREEAMKTAEAERMQKKEKKRKADVKA